jgi:Ricin-type beta-trefoil lectin domain-like
MVSRLPCLVGVVGATRSWPQQRWQSLSALRCSRLLPLVPIRCTGHGSGAQQWLWEESPTGGGTILLNTNSGLCLNIPGQNPNEGTQLWLWACNPNPMQYWSGVGQV